MNHYTEVYALVETEAERAMLLHGPWTDESKYTPRAMVKIIEAERIEAELAVEMGDLDDCIKECVHTANVAMKTATELLRRKRLLTYR